MCPLLLVHVHSAGAAAHASLTASSCLQRLVLGAFDAPRAAWQHMFAAGTRLPHLTALHVLEMPDVRGGSDFKLSAEDAECLARSCSALQQLDVRLLQNDADAAQHGAHAAQHGALRQLTSLTRLRAVNVTDQTLGEVLSHMTQVMSGG